MCQLSIKKLKEIEEKAVSPATGGLTFCLRAQFAGAYHGQVGSSCSLCAGGLWPEISGAPCEDTNLLIESH